LSTDGFVNTEVLGNYFATSFFGDRGAVKITYDVRGARSPTRDDARQQHRTDVTERRVVVLALVNHEAVVTLGERGVSSPR
jgi:hypothetical protein